MLQYSWPGNVGEIENAIEYAAAVGRGQTIQPEDLPIEVSRVGTFEDGPPPGDLRNALKRHLILDFGLCGAVQNRKSKIRYHRVMQEDERFIPKGAIAFFVAMITLYAAIWFLLVGIMVRRG